LDCAVTVLTGEMYSTTQNGELSRFYEWGQWLNRPRPPANPLILKDLLRCDIYTTQTNKMHIRCILLLTY
jgi:hypothetical protein